MNFIKNLFGGAGGGASSDRGLYFYVRPFRCDQLMKIRVDPMNDLSKTDDGDGYIVRKMTKEPRCPFETELMIYFDKNKNITNKEVTRGELISVEEYDAWLAEKTGNTT